MIVISTFVVDICLRFKIYAHTCNTVDIITKADFGFEPWIKELLHKLIHNDEKMIFEMF